MSQFYDLDNTSTECQTPRIGRLTRYRTMQERFARAQGRDVARRRLVALQRRPAPGTWLAL